MLRILSGEDYMDIREKIRECERCGHQWLKRKSDEVRQCPKCKSAYWNVPKEQEQTHLDPSGKDR